MAPILLLCADGPLRDSLADLLAGEGRHVAVEPLPPPEPTAMVIATCDAWPAGWSLSRLRATFHRVPCLVMSGSPLAGDFALAGLERGYFLALPATPRRILRLVAEVCGD